MRTSETIGTRLARAMHRQWPAFAMLAVAGLMILSAGGCAVLAGGAAGAATGYVAGHEAGDGD